MNAIYLGRIERPHGLKGGVKVRLHSGKGSPHLPRGTEVLLKDGRRLTVSRCSSMGTEVCSLTFEEVRNRDDAEALRDASLLIARSEMENRLEYVPLHVFMGMRIISRGSRLEITGLQANSANPLVLVSDGDNQFHVPVVLLLAEGDVNWSQGTVKLDLPAGLEDLAP